MSEPHQPPEQGNSGGQMTEQQQRAGLSQSETKDLVSFMKDASRRTDWMAANVILLNRSAGWSAEQIAQFYGVNPTIVANCIDVYGQTGLKGLRAQQFNW